MTEKGMPFIANSSLSMSCNHSLAQQATLLVEPADKRQSLEFRGSLVVGSSLIERFDSEEASDLLARKTNVLEIPNFRYSRELLSYFHSCPPDVSEPPVAGWILLAFISRLEPSYSLVSHLRCVMAACIGPMLT
jgi:hypothetical protein